jgi:predicted phage terminase large subunit-like protein
MKQNKPRSFTAAQIENFTKVFLLDKYDEPVPIPDMHREVWGILATGKKKVAIAAPRFHAKSTAFTHALTLFLMLFRIKHYGVIVSNTEGQSSQFLGDIKTELLENQHLRETFGIKEIVKDAVTDIIVEFKDGKKFRLQAKGAEQKIRGIKWGNRRPDWIVIDDLEEDELVNSDERREKLKDWFLKALLPCLSKKGTLLVVGTILHLDSLLMGLMTNKSFEHRLYKAHKGFDDFSELLWPEQWSEEALKEVRQNYIDSGNPEGYSQEWLNDPLSHSEAFFRRSDFKELDKDELDIPTTNYAAVDFAISDKDKAAYTVMIVGGLDAQKRLIIKQVVRFRGDGNEILETMFQVQKLYNIEMWKLEKGQILLTLMGELHDRMASKNVYLNINPGTPTNDKRSRARAIQARMRAGGVYFDKEADWFPTFEEELLQFPKGKYKDQVDAISWLGIAINELHEGPTTQELEDEEYNERVQEFNPGPVGRNETTGY